MLGEALIHQPRPPYEIGALFSAVGVNIRRSGLLRHVTVFNIRSQWQEPEILIFVVGVYYEK